MSLTASATNILVAIFVVFVLGASAIIVAALLMRLLAVILALFGVNVEG